GKMVLWGMVGWANWARFRLEIKNGGKGYRNRRELRHFQRGYEGQRGFWSWGVDEGRVEYKEDREYDYRRELRESRVYGNRREYDGRREHKGAREYESRREYEGRREHKERKAYEDRR
ncbi:hypothetical protein QBC36DRAFT_185667, partial [Triangularia setosa]